MKATKVELYNSNNGLGYGGKVGRHTYYDNGLRRFVGNYCYNEGQQTPACEWAVLIDGLWVIIDGVPSNNVYIYTIKPTKETIIYHTASFIHNNKDFLTLVKTIPFTL